jgi:hypothetical protein
MFNRQAGNPFHIPLGSANASTILSLDSFATYASFNHGDSWSIIGTGLSASYPPNVIMAFGPDGTGYALSDGILYRTTYFKSSVSSPSAQSSIALYPIPCTSAITIRADDIERVEIVDLLGVTRMNLEFQRVSDPQLDVSTLAPGVYSMVIVTGGQRELVRMVKE